MKVLKGFLISILILWGQLIMATAQNGVQLETPQIFEGAVLNDSTYYSGIALGTVYTGDAPFIGWERGVFYSLDEGKTWEPAKRKELPLIDQLDFASNSFPGNGFEADGIQIYHVAPVTTGESSMGLMAAAADTTIGIWVKSDYNCIEAATLDDGNFVITWRKKDAQGYDKIYCQVFGSQGNKIGGAYLVCSQQPGLSAYLPKSRITTLDDGSFIITWENHASPSSPSSNVQARILRFKNGVISERNAIALNTVSGKNNMAPVITRVTGGFMAFTRQWWFDSQKPFTFNSGFYGRQYDINGTASGSFINIASTNSTNTEVSNSGPALLTLVDGSRAFVWEERPAQLFVQKLNSNFSQSGSRLKIADVKAYEWTATANTGNGFLVSWLGSSNTNITGQFFTTSGSKDGSSFLVNNKPNTEAYRPYACPHPDGGSVLSWLQYNKDEKRYQFTMRKYATGLPSKDIEYFPAGSAWNFSFAMVNGTSCLSSYLNAQDNRDLFLFAGLKFIYSDTIYPAKDISIECKVSDPATGNEWLSNVRSYLYANPEDGLGSSLAYTDGISNSKQTTVKIALTPGRYKSLELYQQEAVYENGECGAFSAWESLGTISTLTTEMDVSLADGYGYRFKYVITNLAGRNFEIASTHVLCCDLTPPALSVLSEKLEQFSLQLAIDYNDTGSGLEQVNCKVNNNDAGPVTGNTLTLALIPGYNFIMLEARDKAGNRTVKQIFKTIEVVTPEIILGGIKSGAVYGGELAFRFDTTVALQDTGVYLDDNFVKPVTPGMVNLDLSSYPEGNHRLSVKGRVENNTLIEKEVDIIIQYGAFSLVLLSPAAKEYGSNTLTIEYWASIPVTKVWYTLNNEEDQIELVLQDLPDGDYELTLFAENAQGRRESASVRFSVREAFPVLEIINPVNGKFFPTKNIELLFTTNADVEYELGEEKGTAFPGQTLTLPEDGDYELLLTAKHHLSGNIIRKSVNFTVDTVAPEIQLYSPEPKLYTASDINLNYSTNKFIYETNLYLDGEHVNTLQNLKPGAHTFLIKIIDQAGRTAEKHADFRIAKLEITSPLEDEKIVSTDYPCIVPFSYAQEGWAGTLTGALDNQAARLITDPPGKIIPLESVPGNHELYLRGYMNEFNVVRKTQFQIGKKNLLTGPGSIDYTYSAPLINGEYDVTVNLNIKNNGDLDISEPVNIRFDAIGQAGSVTSYWRGIYGLAAGGNSLIKLENIRARLGDLFVVSIDPERRLTGEDPQDNAYKIEFLTGQITGIENSFPAGNTYLSDVSVWDEIKVETAGPVAYVEIHAGEQIFIDNSPQDGFNIITDLGLLRADNNYLQILAYGANHVLLDSRRQYYTIKSMPEQMGHYVFPWNLFASEAYNDYNHIVINETDRKALFSMKNDMMLNALSHPPCVIPQLEANNRVTYRVLAVVQEGGQSAKVSRGTATLGNIDEDIPVGDYADIGGGKKLPNGRGLLAEFSFDPVSMNCSLNSFTPFLIDTNTDEYFQLLQSAWEQIAANIDKVLFEKLRLEELFYGNTISRVATTNPHSLTVYRNIGNIDNFVWETTLNFNDCFICSLMNENEVELRSNGGYHAKGTGTYSFTLGKNDSGKDHSNFILSFLASSSYSYNYFVQNIPIDVSIDINALIETRNGFAILNPIVSRLVQKNDYRDRPLFNSSSSNSFLNLIFVSLFSGSTNYESRFSLATSVNADVVSVTNPDFELVTTDPPFFNVSAALDFTVTKEWEKCFLWWCWGGKYNVVERHDRASAGAPYTDKDIKNFIDTNSK